MATPAGWAGAFALLGLSLGVAMTLMRRRSAASTSPPTSHHTEGSARYMADSSPVSCWFPAGMRDLALTGPSAEDAVRRLALDVLTNQRREAIDMAITRPDAWRLFGIDVETLQDERIPGLVLADDTLQRTSTQHALQGVPRRLLITYIDRPEGARWLLSLQTSRRAAVSQAPKSAPSVEVGLGGRTVRDSIPEHMPERLPLMSRQGAFEYLIALPTLARYPANRER
jgi:hypothetical protein